MAASVPGKNGTEIKETSKNESMPIAKSEPNDTNSMNVSTQVSNPLEAKNDTVNATDKDASLKNVVNKIREELKRMRFGRQTASSMLQSSQMAIRQMQDISFEEEREEDIDRRGEEKQPWGKVSAKGKNCRQDFPCGYHDYDYYWCKLSGGSWDYCCMPSSKCNKQGSCYTSRLRQAQQIGWPWGHPKVRTWARCKPDKSVREAENITLDRPVVTTRPAKTFDYVKQEMNWANARNELPGVAGGGGVGSD